MELALANALRQSPSKSDLFFQNDGAHECGYDHAERAEGRDEHRSTLPRHEALHVVGNAGTHYALNTSSMGTVSEFSRCTTEHSIIDR
jgi:hypothetical protein